MMRFFVVLLLIGMVGVVFAAPAADTCEEAIGPNGLPMEPITDVDPEEACEGLIEDCFPAEFAPSSDPCPIIDPEISPPPLLFCCTESSPEEPSIVGRGVQELESSVFAVPLSGAPVIVSESAPSSDLITGAVVGEGEEDGQWFAIALIVLIGFSFMIIVFVKR